MADSSARRDVQEEQLEQLQIELRYAFNFRGSLTEVLGDQSISDRTIRHLLLALDVEITARLTGEPKQLLPFDTGGFRGIRLPSHTYYAR